MALGDVGVFHRFARLYDRAMYAAEPETLTAGLDLAERPVERLLDAGGGTGRASRALDVPRPVVVDAARGMLREARGHGLETVQGDAARLPVAEESVDAVVVVDALHHMADVDGVIEAAHRVLRPGGALVVREFDPTTLRGRGLVAAEHLVGFDSRFLAADALAERVTAGGFRASIPDRGFGYTVAGVKPAVGEGTAGSPNQ
ncbi:methyltransferase domain-containing protein [Halosimplex rubrum]|uniref:Methyltransferase domain-containing protein n=1 Tax=Halosimplex rubrum TaxID=869889 RepID=A0A7D5SY04_9EURY|nr:methyltransferase domain-containing protein [Halosimplex rubrum]QLH75928.1 methyltransferase domain-containing protein [Halosimplex rubrum]